MADANPYAQFVAPDAGAAATAEANPYAQFVTQDSGAGNSASAGEIVTDVAKQIPSGLISGVEGMATAVPRIFGAAGPAISSAIESAVAKVSPKKAAEMHQAEVEREAFVAGNRPVSINDYLPSPQTPEGRFARTGSEFIPGFAAAPGNLVRNVGTGTLAGLASEGAGEATEGTAAEPYARIGGALVGGLTGASTLAPRVGAGLTPQQVINAGSEAYRSPALSSVLIRPNVAQDISTNILDQLSRSRFNDRLAPQTRAIVDDLATPVGGNVLHTMEDFQTTRQLLEKQASNFNNPTEQAAASRAIRLLDQHVAQIPQSALVSGDIDAANETLTAGRADYAAGKAAERVQQKLDNAELQAASAHSGGNIDNATRQKLRTVLTNPKQSRGLTADELDQIDQVVRGSPTGNVLRAAGKILGGGGGLGSMVSAAEGMHVAGPLGAAAPIAGYAIKRAGDALTERAANRAVQQILSRAPSATNLQPQATPYLGPSRGGLVGALLAGAALPPQSTGASRPLTTLQMLLNQQGAQGQPSQ